MNLTNILLQASNDSILQAIKHDVDLLLESNQHDFWGGDFYMVAVISLGVSIIGLLAIYFELRNNLIDEECQLKLLSDLIRHLYRNKICTVAMRAKYNYEKKKDKRIYPSEEHYRKLQLLPDDIHLDRYNHDSQIYDKLHELELLLRNYNTEIEVAECHMKDPNIDNATKQRDFDTLDFKTGHLTKAIVNVMYMILKKTWTLGWIRQYIKQKKSSWLRLIPSFLHRLTHFSNRIGMDQVEEYAYSIIEKCHNGNLEQNQRTLCKWGDKYADELQRLRQGEDKRDKYFTNVFKSGKEFTDREKQMITCFSAFYGEDLLIECGQNQKGEERIHIIQAKA